MGVSGPSLRQERSHKFLKMMITLHFCGYYDPGLIFFRYLFILYFRVLVHGHKTFSRRADPERFHFLIITR